MRSLFLLLVLATFIALGVSAPFVMALGYVWVDIVTPHRISYSLIEGVRLSQIVGILAVISLFLHGPRKPPQLPPLFWLLVLWMTWITTTTTWAYFPEPAWEKWAWAVKAVAFGAFIPFVFRTRVQLESLVLIIIFSLSCLFISGGIKTVLSGGSYGNMNAVVQGNSGLAESSTLALVSAMVIPYILYFPKHSVVFANTKFIRIAVLSFVALAGLTVIGTQARTGLLALCALALSIVVLAPNRDKYKIIFVIVLLSPSIWLLAPSSWKDRMGTVVSYKSDMSASGRIAVWKWTLEFVKENPTGGGFGVYRANRIQYSLESKDGSGGVEPKIHYGQAKAFHSIYFEILGEHGYPGLAIFLAIMVVTWRTMSALRKGPPQSKNPEWIFAMSKATQQSLVVFLVGGTFIGIAFQPIPYFILGIALALNGIASNSGSSLPAKEARRRLPP